MLHLVGLILTYLITCVQCHMELHIISENCWYYCKEHINISITCYINSILLHDLQRSRKLMGIKKPWIIAYVGICECEICWHYFIHCAVDNHWTHHGLAFNPRKYENVVLPDKENVQTSNFKLHCMENPRALSIVSICASW